MGYVYCSEVTLYEVRGGRVNRMGSIRIEPDQPGSTINEHDETKRSRILLHFILPKFRVFYSSDLWLAGVRRTADGANCTAPGVQTKTHDAENARSRSSAMERPTRRAGDRNV